MDKIITLYYVVVVRINERDYNESHMPDTAEQLFAEEIQSNLESCEEPTSVHVVPISKEKTLLIHNLCNVIIEAALDTDSIKES